MTVKKRLRRISLLMLLAAVIFVLCALSNPALGTAFYIGSVRIGADVWRVFYALYAGVTLLLFAVSFLVKSSE